MRTKLVLASVACAMLSACANLNPLDGQDLTDGFSERVIEVNSAYRSERNAQILINILRARDRQDRKYTGLSPLKITPSSKESTKYTAAGIGLGNNTGDPWVKLGADRTLDDSSNLELTIQPFARDAKEGAVYTSPLTPEQFQTLWSGDWPKDIVRKLLVREVKPLFVSSGSAENAAVISGIGSARGAYTVFSLASAGKLVHCFDAEVCKLEKSLQTNPKDADKPLSRFDYKLSGTLPAAITVIPEQRKPLDANKLLDEKTGRFLFCRQEGAGVPVQADKGPSGVGVAHDVYRCSGAPISPSACAERDKDGKCTTSINLPTPLFWVDERGVYTVALNSIDNVIYKLGSELRRYSGETDLDPSKKDPLCPAGLICSRDEVSFSREFETTKLPLIAIGSEATLSGKPLDKCRAQFSAAVRHADGQFYYAGPPQAFAPGKGEQQSACHVEDRTGTVLTLIAELIEMRQAPVAPAPSTLFFRE